MAPPVRPTFKHASMSQDAMQFPFQSQKAGAQSFTKQPQPANNGFGPHAKYITGIRQPGTARK